MFIRFFNYDLLFVGETNSRIQKTTFELFTHNHSIQQNKKKSRWRICSEDGYDWWQSKLLMSHHKLVVYKKLIN